MKESNLQPGGCRPPALPVELIPHGAEEGIRTPAARIFTPPLYHWATSAWLKRRESNPRAPKDHWFSKPAGMTDCHPFNVGAPPRTRTPNLTVRNRLLYSIELARHWLRGQELNLHRLSTCRFSRTAATPHCRPSVVRVGGFEPPRSAWKADMLPLTSHPDWRHRRESNPLLVLDRDVCEPSHPSGTWSQGQASNLRLPSYDVGALPSELPRHVGSRGRIRTSDSRSRAARPTTRLPGNGTAGRNRTCNLRLIRPVRWTSYATAAWLRKQVSNPHFMVNSQACYRYTTPEHWCRGQDSNLRGGVTPAVLQTAAFIHSATSTRM